MFSLRYKIVNIIKTRHLYLQRFNIFRNKSNKNGGNSLKNKFMSNLHPNLENDEDFDDADKEYDRLASECFKFKEHSCFIVHPYIKWGPKKVTKTSPQSQIAEAIALVNTLTYWKVQDTVIVPLENIDKKTLFGSGNLEKLKIKIRQDKEITSVFINTSVLKSVQINELETVFGVPVFDRYKIVVQILRLHAISTHAKLQVALAEIPYLRSRIKYIESGGINALESKRKLLNDKELKIKTAIKKLRSQRELLRNKRRQMDFPIVAIVGYTNCGKTSLIKALTGDKKLEPRNQLFATLDVTMHVGLLPSRLEVLYVDTVGFISNIPTNLIECFVATLEDAMLANVIVHVQDVSNEDMEHQSQHVLSTLELLAKKTDTEEIVPRIISVGNKIDTSTNKLNSDTNTIYVSAKTETGIDVLRHRIEEAVLKATGRIIVSITVPAGGHEYRWLYKNAKVVDQTIDEKNQQHQILKIIITKSKIKQFHHNFIETKN